MPNANYQASKYRPRGFESLEPRYALDGAALSLPTQLPLPTLAATPAVTAAPAAIQTLPTMGMRVYTAPIGPVPASAKPVAGTATVTTTILPPFTLNAAALVNGSVLPIGPARPATLPSQTLPAQPPATTAPPLYADGVLPPNQTPANLPTSHESMPIITPPGVPTFTLFPARPLY